MTIMAEGACPEGSAAAEKGCPSLEDRLQSVFRDTFADPTITLVPTMTARDIPGWDSLAHVELLMAIENEFGIRFTTAEIAALKQVGDLQDTVGTKLAAKG